MAVERPLLVDTGRGLSLKYGQLWLYSSRNPVFQAAETVRNTKIEADTLYLIPSPCLGYGIRELLDAIPKSSAVLCIEAEPALYDLYKSTAPNCFISKAADAIQAMNDIEQALGLRFRRCTELRLSGGWVIHEKLYSQIKISIDSQIAARFRNRLAMIKMGRLWTKNVIDNLASMDWDRLGLIENAQKPVLVCGAGPSLDLILEDLAEVRSSLFILAADTAIGALYSKGIKADAIVCLEAQVYNTEDFLPLSGDGVAAIVDLTSHPSTFKNLNGSFCLCISEWTESAFLSRLARGGLPVYPIPALASVGILAIRIARILGGPILAAGLDFSFLQGKTHCSGSPARLKEERLEKRLWKQRNSWEAAMRSGVSKLRPGLFTDPALSMYAELAALELTEAKNEGILCIDCRNSNTYPLPFHYALDLKAAVKTAELFVQSHVKNEKQRTFGQRAASPDCKKAAISFLENELHLLDRLGAALSHGMEKDKIKRLLADCNYIFAHFPDPERVLALEIDALKRCSAEVAYWRGRLEMAMTRPGANA